jgi:hypothetical protein
MCEKYHSESPLYNKYMQIKNGENGWRGRDDRGDVTNVQYKSNWNCHYESPLCNEYIPAKIYFKNGENF